MTDSSESQDTTARLMEEIAALKSKVASAEADAARSSREKLDFKARNDALQQQLDTYAATKEATEGVGFEEAEEEAKKSVETLADGDVRRALLKATKECLRQKKAVANANWGAKRAERERMEAVESAKRERLSRHRLEEALEEARRKINDMSCNEHGVSNSAAYKRFQRVIIERLEGENRLLKEEIEMLKAKLSGRYESPKKDRTYYVGGNEPPPPTDEDVHHHFTRADAVEHYRDVLNKVQEDEKKSPVHHPTPWSPAGAPARDRGRSKQPPVVPTVKGIHSNPTTAPRGNQPSRSPRVRNSSGTGENLAEMLWIQLNAGKKQ